MRLRSSKWPGQPQLVAGVLALLALSGCAAGAPTSEPDHSTIAPTPTVACPSTEGADLPPECAPYDPDSAMNANDMYRQRTELDADAAAENQAAATPAQAALEAVRASGDISVETVSAALEDAGLVGIQVREDYSRVLFGTSGPAGGCIYGEVTGDTVTIGVGGFILDGGCLPAQ